MEDKEQLEERLNVVFKNVSEQDKKQLVEIKNKKFKDYTLEDYMFLHEQAERKNFYKKLHGERSVQLEARNIEYRKLEQQNKRYREVIEDLDRLMRIKPRWNKQDMEIMNVLRKLLEESE